MGVPNLYRFISERYPLSIHSLTSLYQSKIDKLYLDATTVFYRIIELENSLPHQMGPQEVFDAVFCYLDNIIRSVAPRQLVYIAFDGVAPVAKMKQQRQRRLTPGSIDMASSCASLATSLISRSQFNPGTIFTTSMAPFLTAAFAEKVEQDPFYSKLTVVVSGSDVPGEAEHKIMDSIRYDRTQDLLEKAKRNDQTPYLPTTAIFSPDSDLIILALISQIPNMLLVFEQKDFMFNDDVPDMKKIGQEPWAPPLELLSCSILRDYLTLEFKPFFKDFEFKIDRLLDDLVIVLALCGNDFVPKAPSLIINKNIIDSFFTFYKELIPITGWITDNSNLNEPINFNTLSKFFMVFQRYEYDWFLACSRDKSAETDESEDFEDDFNSFDNEKAIEEYIAHMNSFDKMFSDLPYYELNDLKLKYSINDPGFLKQEKRKYYRKRFNLPTPQDASGEDHLKIQDILKSYYDTVIFVFLYYTRSGTPDWDFMYKYTFAPCLSDIINYTVESCPFKPNEAGVPRRSVEAYFSAQPFSSYTQLPITFNKSLKKSLQYFNTDGTLEEFFCPTHYRNNLKEFRTRNGEPHHSYVADFDMPSKDSVRELLSYAESSEIIDVLSTRGAPILITSKFSSVRVAEFIPSFWALFSDATYGIGPLTLSDIFERYKIISDPFSSMAKIALNNTHIIMGPQLFASDNITALTSVNDQPFTVARNHQLYFCCDPRSLDRAFSSYASSPVAGQMVLEYPLSTMMAKPKSCCIKGKRTNFATTIVQVDSSSLNITNVKRSIRKGDVILANWPYFSPFKVVDVIFEGKLQGKKNEISEVPINKIADIYYETLGIKVDCSLLFICVPITCLSPEIETIAAGKLAPVLGSVPTVPPFMSAVHFDKLGYAFPAPICAPFTLQSANKPAFNPSAFLSTLSYSLPRYVPIDSSNKFFSVVVPKDHFIAAASTYITDNEVTPSTFSATDVIPFLSKDKLFKLTIASSSFSRPSIPFGKAAGMLKISTVTLESLIARCKITVGTKTIYIGFNAYSRSSKSYSPRWLEFYDLNLDADKPNPFIRSAKLTPEAFEILSNFIAKERNFVDRLNSLSDHRKLSVATLFSDIDGDFINDFGPYSFLKHIPLDGSTQQNKFAIVERNLIALNFLMLTYYGMPNPKIPIPVKELNLQERPVLIKGINSLPSVFTLREELTPCPDYDLGSIAPKPLLNSDQRILCGSIVQPIIARKIRSYQLPTQHAYGIVVATLPNDEVLVAWNVIELGFRKFGGLSDFSNMSVAHSSLLSPVNPVSRQGECEPYVNPSPMASFNYRHSVNATSETHTEEFIQLFYSQNYTDASIISYLPLYRVIFGFNNYDDFIDFKNKSTEIYTII